VSRILLDPKGPKGPTAAKINLESIAKNFDVFRKVAPHSRICAVVKANAYGHGMGPVSRRLAKQGCETFAVGALAEGLALRDEGIAASILLLQGAAPSSFEILEEKRLTPVISSLETLEAFGEKAQCLGRPLSFHLKFDTGMGRLGLLPNEAHAAAETLRRYPLLKLVGAATHLARAGESFEYTRNQLDLFEQVLAALRSMAIDPGTVHAANTAACLSEPKAHYNMARIGLGLFGAVPEAGLPNVELLSPALSWTTRIQHMREVPAGTMVSYGSTFQTKRKSRLAVIPVGYADGYSRSIGNNGFALVRGKRVPVVGRVCMDMTILDVTDEPSPSIGDEVALLGAQGSEAVTAEEMAGWLGTIPYEILSRIGPRVPRTYLD